MYGVIGEDPSDVETLKVLIRRLANNEKLPVFVKGYSGCGEMLRKGASQLKLFAGKGVVRFVVCYDADRGNPVARELEARQKVWDKALADGIHGECCIVVPIQELEAWILADLSSVSKVITSWTPKDVSSPELINDPCIIRKSHSTWILRKLPRNAVRLFLLWNSLRIDNGF